MWEWEGANRQRQRKESGTVEGKSELVLDPWIDCLAFMDARATTRCLIVIIIQEWYFLSQQIYYGERSTIFPYTVTVPLK